jgi:gas vesicle protein
MADRAGGKVVWFATGIVVGAGVALLFAPASGQEIRRKIVEKTDQGRAALAEQGWGVYDRGMRMIERGRRLADEAAEMFERGRKLVEQITQGDMTPGRARA